NASGMRQMAPGRILVPFDVGPGQDLFESTMRTGDEALPLIARGVFATDPGRTLLGRRADPDELRPADIVIGRVALFGELDWIAVRSGAQRILIDLVEQNDPLRPRGQIRRRIGADEVDRPSRVRLMRQRVFAVARARLGDEIP